MAERVQPKLLDGAAVSGWEALEQLTQRPDQPMVEFVEEFEAACAKMEAANVEERLPDRYKALMLLRRLCLSDGQRSALMDVAASDGAKFEALKRSLLSEPEGLAEAAEAAAGPSGKQPFKMDLSDFPPELIGNICGWQDRRDLVRARAVSKTFRAAVHQVCRDRNQRAFTKEQLDLLSCCVRGQKERPGCGCLEAQVGFTLWKSVRKVEAKKLVVSSRPLKMYSSFLRNRMVLSDKYIVCLRMKEKVRRGIRSLEIWDSYSVVVLDRWSLKVCDVLCKATSSTKLFLCENTLVVKDKNRALIFNVSNLTQVATVEYDPTHLKSLLKIGSEEAVAEFLPLGDVRMGDGCVVIVVSYKISDSNDPSWRDSILGEVLFVVNLNLGNPSVDNFKHVGHLDIGGFSNNLYLYRGLLLYTKSILDNIGAYDSDKGCFEAKLRFCLVDVSQPGRLNRLGELTVTHPFYEDETVEAYHRYGVSCGSGDSLLLGSLARHEDQKHLVSVICLDLAEAREALGVAGAAGPPTIEASMLTVPHVGRKVSSKVMDPQGGVLFSRSFSTVHCLPPPYTAWKKLLTIDVPWRGDVQSVHLDRHGLVLVMEARPYDHHLLWRHCSFQSYKLVKKNHVRKIRRK